MAVKEIVPIENHVVEAIELLPEQFKNLEQKFPDPNHPKKLVSGWEAILTAFVNPAQKYENICQDLLRSYDLRFTTGRALNRLGELVGQVRAGKTDEEYRTAILIKIGANNSEGTYNDLVGLYEMFGLSVQSYLEPRPATFLFHLGSIAKETMKSVKEVTEVAKAAGVAYEFTGVISDPSDPIDKDEPLFIFKSGGKGEYFATMLEDGSRSDYGGRWSLLLSAGPPPAPPAEGEMFVGSIQLSLLDEAQFATAMGVDADKWILADGRNVSGSEYTRITTNESVPNMTGMFTRMYREERSGGFIPSEELFNTQPVGESASDTLSFNKLDSEYYDSYTDPVTGIESGYPVIVTQVGGTEVNVGSQSFSVSGNLNQFNNKGGTVGQTGSLIPRLNFRTLAETVYNSGNGVSEVCRSTSDALTTSHSFTISSPHTHELNLSGTFSSSGTTASKTSTTAIAARLGTITGSAVETRPKNIAVNYYIRIN